MRTLTIAVWFVLGVSCQSTPTEKQSQPIHSLPESTVAITDSSLQHMSGIIQAYEVLRDALVEYNSTAVDSAALHLSSLVKDFTPTGIQDKKLADSVGVLMFPIQKQSTLIPTLPTLEEKKRAFSVLSTALYSILTAIQYNEGIIYKQTCPMAFNESEAASWISRSAEINNPYLGKKHPKYQSGMLHCGEITDSVAFKK